MSPEVILSLIGIALAASWTPGPNNSMLASSGATYGVRASLPHVLGVTFGFPVMIFLVGLGLGELFRQNPALQQILRYAGAAMLLWLAWKTATAAPPGSGGKSTRPLTFLQAAVFQWVNPKAWIAAIAVTTQFVSPDRPVGSSAIAALAFVGSGLTSTFAWVSFGQVIGGWLRTTARLRAFNLTMAALLVGFLILLMFEQSLGL
jgi:threonine/homoserine/homoserine lactone efflux protein